MRVSFVKKEKFGVSLNACGICKHILQMDFFWLRTKFDITKILEANYIV